MTAVGLTIIGSGLLNTFSDNLKYIIIPIILLVISLTLYFVFVYLNKRI